MKGKLLVIFDFAVPVDYVKWCLIVELWVFSKSSETFSLSNEKKRNMFNT